MRQLYFLQNPHVKPITYPDEEVIAIKEEQAYRNLSFEQQFVIRLVLRAQQNYLIVGAPRSGLSTIYKTLVYLVNHRFCHEQIEIYTGGTQCERKNTCYLVGEGVALALHSYNPRDKTYYIVFGARESDLQRLPFRSVSCVRLHQSIHPLSLREQMLYSVFHDQQYQKLNECIISTEQYRELVDEYKRRMPGWLARGEAFPPDGTFPVVICGSEREVSDMNEYVRGIIGPQVGQTFFTQAGEPLYAGEQIEFFRGSESCIGIVVSFTTKRRVAYCNILLGGKMEEHKISALGQCKEYYATTTPHSAYNCKYILQQDVVYGIAQRYTHREYFNLLEKDFKVLAEKPLQQGNPTLNEEYISVWELLDQLKSDNLINEMEIELDIFSKPDICFEQFDVNVTSEVERNKFDHQQKAFFTDNDNREEESSPASSSEYYDSAEFFRYEDYLMSGRYRDYDEYYNSDDDRDYSSNTEYDDESLASLENEYQRERYTQFGPQARAEAIEMPSYYSNEQIFSTTPELINNHGRTRNFNDRNQEAVEEVVDLCPSSEEEFPDPIVAEEQGNLNFNALSMMESNDTENIDNQFLNIVQPLFRRSSIYRPGYRRIIYEERENEDTSNVSVISLD